MPDTSLALGTEHLHLFFCRSLIPNIHVWFHSANTALTRCPIWVEIIQFPSLPIANKPNHIVSNPFVFFYWKIWRGNSDTQTVVENIFPSPISARFVRVFPVSYKYEICLRMELYGCRNGKYFSFLQNLSLPVTVSLNC